MSEARINQMIGRLSSAFTREPGSNIDKLIRTTEAELQVLEDTGNAILSSHQYENATGASLDHFAAIYGVTRLQSDTDAAVRLRIAIAANVRNASGTISDIISMASRITGYAESDIEMVEFEATVPAGGWGLQPWGTSPWGGSYRSAASFRLVFHGSGTGKSFTLDDLANGINRVRAAGVTFNVNATQFVT